MQDFCKHGGVMQDCANHSCASDGALPGYKVKRRAPDLYRQLTTAVHSLTSS
jgi:hypothetical protein